MKNNDFKIIVTGSAGNGINFFSEILISQLLKKFRNSHISYYFDYDSNVRGGIASSFISISSSTENPFIFKHADLVVILNTQFAKKFKAKEKIGTYIDFASIARDNLNDERKGNMIALGFISAKYDLPKPKLNEENLKAFKIGTNLYNEKKRKV